MHTRIMKQSLSPKFIRLTIKPVNEFNRIRIKRKKTLKGLSKIIVKNDTEHDEQR